MTYGLREGTISHSRHMSALGAQLMKLISEGIPWRSKHLIERAAHGSRPSAVRREMELLAEQGLIANPRWGVWTLAGMPAPSAEELPPLRTARKRGPTEQKLLTLLSTPTSRSALVKQLSVTHQRVSQILERLSDEGKAVRIPDPEGTKRCYWCQPGACTADFLRPGPPSLTDGRRQVLNALEPNGRHAIRDVATAVGQTPLAVHSHVRELEKRGFVARFRLGPKRYITITPRGLDHPARLPSATHAATVDFSKAFGEQRCRIIETLAVLEEARTADITAALTGTGKPATKLFSSQLVRSLVTSDLAEAVRERTDGSHPFYRLTDAGRQAASLIGRHRQPPAAQEVHERLAAYRARRAERLRDQARGTVRLRPSRAGSPAQQAILDQLAAGACSTPVLRGASRGHHTNPRSIFLTLKTLRDRGAIDAAGREGRNKLWVLATATGQTDRCLPAVVKQDATALAHSRVYPNATSIIH